MLIHHHHIHVRRCISQLLQNILGIEVRVRTELELELVRSWEDI
jgi:hypothetical protein